MHIFSKFILFTLFLSFSHCPIIQKIYTYETGESEIIQREEAQNLIKKSLFFYISKCNTENIKAGIYSIWKPLLEAKPCEDGYLNVKNISINYCYERVFLNKKKIQNCSFLLLISNCSEGNYIAENLFSFKFCEGTLKLDNETTIFKFF